MPFCIFCADSHMVSFVYYASDKCLYHFKVRTFQKIPKAKCRPFMFCFEKDGKLWFCTNNQKEVYKDMQENPEVEISISDASYAWLRLHGRAVFEDNMEVKEGCMENPIVKGQYNTADNPIFVVFYLDHRHGVIADFSGNPPYEF